MKDDLQSVERTGETVKTGGKREHGRAQGRSNQVSGVGTNVTTLVVGVDGKVKAHQLYEVGVVTVAKLVGQVEAIILVLLDGSDLSVLEDVAVDTGSNGGQLGNQVHGVLEGVLPVVLLVHALSIGLGKGRLMLKSGDSEGELGHWVEVRWAAVDEFLNELGDIGTGSPLSREVANLLLGWDLTGKQQPEEAYQLVRPPCFRHVFHPSDLYTPSGNGSWPPGALGRSFWHSGI